MAEPMYTDFASLMQLANPKFVKNNKITCIKLLRGISGEGLKETKDFLEQERLPTLENGFPSKEKNKSPSNVGSLKHALKHVFVESDEKPDTVTAVRVKRREGEWMAVATVEMKGDAG